MIENILELKKNVDDAIDYAKECGVDPKSIKVWVQVDGPGEPLYTKNIELIYDNDGQASGCVILGHLED